jgi:hypothetical protein
MRREALLRERDQLESQRRRSVPPQGADPPPSFRGKADGNHLKEEKNCPLSCVYRNFLDQKILAYIRIHYIRLSGFTLSGYPDSLNLRSGTWHNNYLSCAVLEILYRY